jgi:hypothetical protein
MSRQQAGNWKGKLGNVKDAPISSLALFNTVQAADR